MIAEGHSNKAIADLLSVSPATVETHRAHILQKLDVHNAAELVLYAVRRGVISVTRQAVASLAGTVARSPGLSAKDSRPAGLEIPTAMTLSVQTKDTSHDSHARRISRSGARVVSGRHGISPKSWTRREAAPIVTCR